jgi:hypothetical protein
MMLLLLSFLAQQRYDAILMSSDDTGVEGATTPGTCTSFGGILLIASE